MLENPSGGVLVFCLLLCPWICSISIATTSIRESEVRAKRSDDVSTTSLQTLVQQQTSMLQAQQAQLQALQSVVTSMQATLSIVNSRSSHSVAFSARISAPRDVTITDGVHLSPHETVVFDDSLTNIGSAYSGSTGIFTAPFAGVYVFFLQQMAPNGHDDIFTEIVKNGNVLHLVHAKGHDIYQQGSGEVSVHLAAGDQVWVRQSSGDAIRGGYWSIFTGFLLHTD